MAVYVVQAGEGGPVKIGFTNKPRRRIAELQTGLPQRLRVLHLFDGSEEDERRLHRRFAEHRVSGEWFHPVADIVLGQFGLPPLRLRETPRRKDAEWSEAGYASFMAKMAAHRADPDWVARRREDAALTGAMVSVAKGADDIMRVLRSAPAPNSWQRHNQVSRVKAAHQKIVAAHNRFPDLIDRMKGRLPKSNTARAALNSLVALQAVINEHGEAFRVGGPRASANPDGVECGA